MSDNESVCDDNEFVGPDKWGMVQMTHSLKDCGLWMWEFYRIKKKGRQSMEEFVALLGTMYNKKEIANLSADFLWRKMMSLCPKHTLYKEELVDFLVQDMLKFDDDQYEVCYKHAEHAAMTQWRENHCMSDTTNMDSIFQCAKDAFTENAAPEIPDLITMRYALSAANDICIDIIKFC